MWNVAIQLKSSSVITINGLTSIKYVGVNESILSGDKISEFVLPPGGVLTFVSENEISTLSAKEIQFVNLSKNEF